MNHPATQRLSQLIKGIPQLPNAFWVSAIYLSAVTVAALVYLFLFWQYQEWQVLAMAGLATAVGGAATISMGLSQRGRAKAGIRLIIGTSLVAILLASLLIAGLGTVLGLTGMLLMLITATQTLPLKEVNWTVIASTVTGLVASLIDLLELGAQFPSPAIQTFTPALVIVLILISLALIVRQFRAYPLSTKLITTFLVVSLVAVGVVALYTGWTTRTALSEAANQALFAAASQTGFSVDTFIQTNLDSIRTEAQLPDLSDYLALPVDQRAGSPEEARAGGVLRAFSRKDPVFISSYALLDLQGQDVVDTYPPDIGLDKSDRDYFQTPIQTGLPYVSAVKFSDTTSELSLYFSSPVRNISGEIVGVLRVRYNANILQQLIAQNNDLAGPRSLAVLLDEHHIRLAHGIVPDLILRSVAPLDSALVTELQAAGRLPDEAAEELATDLPSFEQALTQVATQPYYSGETGDEDTDEGPDVDTEQSAIVPLNTRPWLVVFTQPQEVFLGPAEEQTQNTLFLGVFIVGIIAGVAVVLGQFLAGPIVRLTEVAQQVTQGNLAAQALVEAQDETGQLALAFNTMTVQLRELIGSLEDQVRERTAELVLSMEIGQQATAIRDLDDLLLTITELIRERFNLYYTQVYFVDDLGQSLILRSGTGTAGEALLARHHQLPIGPGSIVGQVAAEGRAVVVPDTEDSDIHKPNPLLPETRSELAVPLLAEERVIGVLDMQANRVNAFSEHNLTVFEAMATQLAISINSAQQWTLAQEAQQKAQEAIRQLTRETWTEKLAARQPDRPLSVSYDLSAITPFISTGQASLVPATHLMAPLRVQNEPIGHLAVARPPEKGWSEEERTFLEAVAQQLSQKAETLRLFEESQQKAVREQIARQITDKVRASRDMEQAVKTAMQELTQALGVARVVVNLSINNEQLTINNEQLTMSK